MRIKFAFIISIAIHLLIVASLIFSFSFKTSKMVFANPNTQPVKAVFIDAQAIADQKRQLQAEADARKREQQRQARIQREAAAREKKAREDAQRRKQQEQARRKQEQQIQAREREQKAAEQAAREAAELKRQQEQQAAFERQMAEQLAAEQQSIKAAQQQQVMTELQKYQALIYQTIYQNLFIDDSAKNKECILNVKLAPDGLVIDTQILEGDPALCQAARTAVLRPATLPVSKDPLVFEQMKTIRLTVSPQ